MVGGAGAVAADLRRSILQLTLDFWTRAQEVCRTGEVFEWGGKQSESRPLRKLWRHYGQHLPGCQLAVMGHTQNDLQPYKKLLYTGLVLGLCVFPTNRGVAEQAELRIGPEVIDGPKDPDNRGAWFEEMKTWRESLSNASNMRIPSIAAPNCIGHNGRLSNRK